MEDEQIQELTKFLKDGLFNYLNSLSLEELKKIPWLTNKYPPNWTESELREINEN